MPGSLIVLRSMRADSHSAQNPEGDQRSGVVDPRKLTGRLPAFPLLGREQANWRDEHHEGIRERRACGAVWGDQTPEGRNPMSASCLKMAGRLGEEQAAGRLRKP